MPRKAKKNSDESSKASEVPESDITSGASKMDQADSTQERTPKTARRKAVTGSTIDTVPAGQDLEKPKRGRKTGKAGTVGEIEPKLKTETKGPDPEKLPEPTRRTGKRGKQVPSSKTDSGVAEQSEPEISAKKQKVLKGKLVEVEQPTPVSAKQKGKSKSLSHDEKSIAKNEAADEKTVLERSPVKRHIITGRVFKVISWNITTLRSLVNKNPEILKNLISTEKPDLVCLQEIKLNAEDRLEYEEKLKKIIPGHSFHWNFCTLPDSKSYSGTLAIVRGGQASDTTQRTVDTFFKIKKGVDAAVEKSDGASEKIESITMGLPTLREEDGSVAKEVMMEGRTITVEYEKFIIVACYVPNSGDKLQRLDFRTRVWDKRMGEYLADLEKKKPVIFCGDLNVAHLDADIWNAGAKHISKSAGTTPEERRSFSELLSLGFVDAFRHFNPTASGWFSYWSVRAGNRPFNRGLRLDYFVASRSLCEQAGGAKATRLAIGDVAILPDFVAMDHAAIALTLSV